MKKNPIYAAPEAELVEVKVESRFLDSFGQGAGTASANEMDGETWGAWD